MVARTLDLIGTRAGCAATLILDLSGFWREFHSAPAVSSIRETEYVLLKSQANLLAGTGTSEVTNTMILQRSSRLEAANLDHGFGRYGRCRRRDGDDF
jgi:hypothetical protein